MLDVQKAQIELEKHMSEVNNIHISQKAHGLGDAIVGLYTIASLLNKYPNKTINYYNRFTNWIHWWSGRANFKSLSEESKIESIDLWSEYDKELIHSENRKLWYCQRVEENLLPYFPTLDEKKFFRDIGKRIHEKDYIIIVPFATTTTRTWSIHNWHHLSKIIKDKLNLDIILLDSPGDGKRHQFFDCLRYWGQPPNIVMNLLYYSKCVISNDSGLAHLGGLLKKPVIGISSQFKPEKLFSHGLYYPVYKETICSGCQFQEDKGFIPSCNIGCWTLSSITPYDVLDEVEKVINLEIPTQWKLNDIELENTIKNYSGNFVYYNNKMNNWKWDGINNKGTILGFLCKKYGKQLLINDNNYKLLSELSYLDNIIIFNKTYDKYLELF